MRQRRNIIEELLEQCIRSHRATISDQRRAERAIGAESRYSVYPHGAISDQRRAERAIGAESHYSVYQRSIAISAFVIVAVVFGWTLRGKWYLEESARSHSRATRSTRVERENHFFGWLFPLKISHPNSCRLLFSARVDRRRRINNRFWVDRVKC